MPFTFDKVYLQEYTFAQYGDVMFICHPLFAPRMLTRTALDAFEISVYSFDKRADNKVTFQPYSKFQASGVTLDPSATTGSGVTFTTSSAYWVAGHVGTTIRYGGSEVEITGYTSSTVVTGTVVDELKIRLSVLNPLRTIDGTAIIEVTHLSHGFSGSEPFWLFNRNYIKLHYHQTQTLNKWGLLLCMKRHSYCW